MDYDTVVDKSGACHAMTYKPNIRTQTGRWVELNVGSESVLQ